MYPSAEPHLPRPFEVCSFWECKFPLAVPGALPGKFKNSSLLFVPVAFPKRHSPGNTASPRVCFHSTSPEDFIHSSFIPKENEVVIVSEAYQKFLGYCQLENQTRVEFTEFKRVAKDLVMEKFQLGLRHDIRTPEGRQTHGWKHLCLMPAPSEQIVEAA